MKIPNNSHDAAWLECALSDTLALLVDHAHCEKKAAATALSLIARYPEDSELVTAMTELAQEELGHLAEVHQELVARGGRLSRDHGDPYAKALVAHARKQDPERLVDRLLISGLIEARSCQRLKLLAKGHPDPELAAMFKRFAKAEAGHQHLFVALAERYASDAIDVAARLAELTAIEADVVASMPIRCAIH